MTETTAIEVLADFTKENLIRIAEVVKEYPSSIPTHVAAKLLDISDESTRTYLQNGGEYGIAWRKPGKQNCGYSIPTYAFLCKCYGVGFIKVLMDFMKEEKRNETNRIQHKNGTM